VLLGETRDELGGSEWAHHVHGHLGGLPPRVDLGAEKALGALMAGAADGLATAAHDVSDGGLAQTLVEMVLRRGVGARVSLASVAGGDPFVALFAESVARAVVAVPADRYDDLVARASSSGVPVTRIGTTGGSALTVEGLFEVGVDDLRGAHEGTLPTLFG
jgi:phosphoribosylformylglycinamidine synthase